METGRGRDGELQETRAGRDSGARDSTQPESEGEGDATSSGLAGQAKSRTPWASGTPGGTDQAPRPPLHGHRLGDGDVVEKRFVGPVPGVGGHLHRAAAARTQEGIDLVHLPDEASPGAADLKGRPIV